MSLPRDFSIRLLNAGDEALVLNARRLFDYAPIAEQTRAFLVSDREFLWFAMTCDQPVGFVSATSILHPDKEPHLFVNELAVHEDWRRRGIARKLMETVVAFGRKNALWPIWLAAEGDDHRAQAFYRSLSDLSERGVIVFEWEWK